jgi:hypothetical protein
MRFETFWGTRAATTAAFEVPVDAALRILARAGRFTLRVQRSDGTYLGEVADLAEGGLGLLAISRGGTYRLLIDAAADWGVTVVSRIPAGG